VVAAACSGEGSADDAVPTTSSPPPSATVATTTTPAVTTTTLADTYVLQPGDSPSLLADRFGLTMAELEQFNAGNPDYLTFLVGGTIRLTPPPTTTAPPTTAPASTTTQAPTPGQLTMAFSGEVLAHRVINRTALQPDGSYDYWPMLANIAPLVSEADYSICHLEAPIAPPGQDVMVEPQRISSAASITTALAAAGFDRCSTASNHSVDRGAAGVDATVAAFEAAGIGQSGVARSEQERLPAIVVVNDVKVAHLAYSYGFDGTPLPAGEPWRANVIDPAVIIADAQAMRSIGAEVVVVSLHWGASMVSNPTADQQRVADAVTASGAVNLIVGHHSHVLQPITQVNGVWVVWGLSNFLSALPTSDKWPAKSQDGVLVSVTFSRAPDGSIAVSVPTVRTTWCDKADGFVVRATSEQHDPNLSAGVREQLRISEERSRAVVGQFMEP
jgi:poly-gamma-glutamate capsule biosynthesis protein CapA/YwtB (metallophosphatase superfamily)/LysM repeat protein